jgi:sugar/nucleoside kinase (ribokinase family)
LPKTDVSFARPDLLVVGQISRDILIFDGRAEPAAAGGAVYYSAFAAAHAGVRLLCLPKLAAVDYALLGPMWAQGLALLPVYSRQTTTMQDIFERQTNYARRSRVLALASPFSADEIPVPEAEIYHLAGLLHGEFPEALMAQLAARGRLALDAQSVLRHLEGEEVVERDWPLKERCLPMVSFLKADLGEARLLTGEGTVEGALERLHRWGVREAMITEDRGVTVSDGRCRLFAPFPEYTVAGRSGRGDTCFGAYLSFRVAHDLPSSLEHAARLTVRKLQRPGPYLG